MTNQELCKNLRALSPGYYKMDGGYIDIGREAADEIERLNLELRNERDVRAEAERGCASMAKEIKRLVAENKELRAADRGANDDKPLGFRTWDVPDPYAEGPQSDAEPVAWRETLTAARDEIISLLPQDWFENGCLKEPHPVIDKIDTILTGSGQMGKAQSDTKPDVLQNAIAEVLCAEFDEAGPDDMVTYLKSQSQLIAGAIVRQIYTAPQER